MSVAPKHFDLSPDDEVVCVAQPKTDAERALCEDAMDRCPVEAIGMVGTADRG
jgi:ferredoxin